MSLRATHAYLAHRLAVAGYQGPLLFDGRISRVIHRGSGGVPRLINILAHKCLLSAWGEGVDRVNARHLRRAILDTESVRAGPGRLRRLFARALRPVGDEPSLGRDSALGAG
jgi:MSHA biogenesis protein MshM